MSNKREATFYPFGGPVEAVMSDLTDDRPARDELAALRKNLEALADEWEGEGVAPAMVGDLRALSWSGSRCRICGSAGEQAHARRPHAEANIWPDEIEAVSS